ncbi:MAG: DUF2642 domain-containing protein [Actinomycetota bacterium]
MDDRWDRLFADLEGALPLLDEDEIPDLVEAERVGVHLADRLAGAIGRNVDLATTSGSRISGTLREAGPDWIAVVAGRTLHVVRTGSIRWVSALDGAAHPPTGAVHVGLAAVLRRIARSTLPVVADVGGTVVRGRITAVGADHCDLTTESAVLVLPLGGLISMRCDADVLASL